MRESVSATASAVNALPDRRVTVRHTPSTATLSPSRIAATGSSVSIVKRVEPKYPDIAAAAKLTGLVILEALVNESGEVESVKTLRSPSVFLEKAAVEALKQWRYSPLVLDGVPMSFILTVTFNFSVQ